MTDLETRVALLEAGVSEVLTALMRIEDKVNAKATREQVADLIEQLAEVRGRVTMMPSTWQMLVGIIGGQVALAALIPAVVFGIARLMGAV